MSKQEMKVVHQNEDLKKSSTEEEIVNNLYEVLKELPKPETNMKLSASQKKWWYWFGSEFVKTNTLSKVDLMHLQNISVMMDARCKVLKKINDLNRKDPDGVKGWVQKFTSGATNVTGYQTMYEKATKQLDELSARFGLSEKDRKKLGATSSADDGQLDLFDEVLKKLHG